MEPGQATVSISAIAHPPEAFGTNGHVGLTQKELTNKEEKEVAEEKEENEKDAVRNGLNVKTISINGGLSGGVCEELLGETDDVEGGGGGGEVVAPNLASAMDPSQFTLKVDYDVAPNMKKQKPGMNAFLNRNEADTSDPLSSLDPIWNRKGN